MKNKIQILLGTDGVNQGYDVVSKETICHRKKYPGSLENQNNNSNNINYHLRISL